VNLRLDQKYGGDLVLPFASAAFIIRFATGRVTDQEARERHNF
jgi:hypothetical protein